MNTLPHAAKVSLKVYDLLGREVAVLVDNAGEHEVTSMRWVCFGGHKVCERLRCVPVSLQAGDFVQTCIV